MKLFKALVSSRRKTVYILALTSFIVLASIHVNVSTKGADREIINGITKGAGAHARVNLEDAFNLEEYEDELVSLLDSYAGQGVSYERQKYVPLGVSYLGDYLMIQNSDYYVDSLFNTSSHNTSALIHNNSPDGSVYTAIKGKPVDELANHEVAIPYNLLKAHGLTMENALGKQISSEIFADLRLIVFKNTLAGCNPGDEYYEYDGSIKLDCFDELSFQSESNLPLTVASVVTDISMSKMVSGDDFKPGFEFFETDVPETGYVIVSEATYQEIMFDRYLIDFELEKFVREAGYFEAGPSEISSAKNFEEISSFVGGEFPLETYNYNIRYDHYTRVVEDQLAKDVGRIKECVYSCQSIFRLETLSGRLDKEPMVSGVLKVVSSFVLMGVLISSFYSFYIHFSNQLKTSTKEISALLMSGVSWHRIVFVYFIELCIVTLLAVLGFSVLSIIMSKVNTNTILFTQSFSSYFETFKFSLVFFTLIFGLIAAKLYPFRKNVLMKFKSGSKTRIRWTGLSHQSIVRQLSLKRMFTYITSTLGYAFSISLVVLMIVLAFSTGNHIKNVYSKDTFGIHFDYMVFPVANGESEEDGWETFYASESFSLKLLKTGEDYEVLEDEMDLELEEGSYLIYQHSDGKNLYFTQFEKTEGLYDLKSFIWEYNLETKEMTKVLNLNDFDANGLLSNYRIIKDKVHLVTENFNDDGSVYNRVLIIKDGHVVEEKTSLKMRANYNQNYVKFMDDGSYLTLNRVDDKYCYEINGQNLKCFEGELSPNTIPILNLEAMPDDYYIMKESIVTLSNVDEGICPNDIKCRSVVFDRQGNEMYTLENSMVTIVVDKILILQHMDETYSILNLAIGSQEEFVTMSDLY